MRKLGPQQQRRAPKEAQAKNTLELCLVAMADLSKEGQRRTEPEPPVPSATSQPTGGCENEAKATAREAPAPLTARECQTDDDLQSKGMMNVRR